MDGESVQLERKTYDQLQADNAKLKKENADLKDRMSTPAALFWGALLGAFLMFVWIANHRPY